MAEIAFVPGTFTGPQVEVLTRWDLTQHYPGLEGRETSTGGFDVFQPATGRWSGAIELGPFQSRAEARRCIAWLSRLTSGAHYALLPLGEETWTDGPTDADLFVTGTEDGVDGGTALKVNGVRADMQEGMFFVVGDEDDPNTRAPGRVRIITGLAVDAGETTIQQWPPLPQAQTGAANNAAKLRAATSIRARIATPGSGAVPFPRGPGGGSVDAPDGSGYGPFVYDWVEFVQTE